MIHQGGGLFLSFSRFLFRYLFSFLFIGDRGLLCLLLGELTCDYWVHYRRQAYGYVSAKTSLIANGLRLVFAERHPYFRTYYTAFPDLSDIFGRRCNMGWCYAGHRLVHGTWTSCVFIPSLLRHGTMARGCLQREVTLLYLLVLVLDFVLFALFFFFFGSRRRLGRGVVSYDAITRCKSWMFFYPDFRN